MNFGKHSSTNLDGDTFEHKNQVHTWKVGLNYRWGGYRRRSSRATENQQ